MNKNSPEYLAGLRAGRLSYTLTVLVDNKPVVLGMDPGFIATSAPEGAAGVVDIARGVSMMVYDRLSHIENYPDAETGEYEPPRPVCSSCNASSPDVTILCRYCNG